VATDDGASMMSTNHAVSADTVSETAIESDEDAAVTTRPSKAKASAGGALVMAVTQDCGASYQFSLSFSFSSTDLDTTSSRPRREASKAINTLLDRIKDTEIGEQSDEPANIESEPESNSSDQTSSSDSEEGPTVAPTRKPVAKKKVKAKAADSDSDDDDGMDPQHVLVIIAYEFLGIEPFSVMLEIANERKGSCKIEPIQSNVSWVSLRERLAKLLDIYPSSLQVQYRLSTQPKAHPYDLQHEQDLANMLRLIQPLIVPARLANGRRSTRKLKPLTVRVFNKDDVVAVPDKVCYSQVISNACLSLNQLEV